MKKYKFIVNQANLNRKNKKVLQQLWKKLSENDIGFSCEYTTEEITATELSKMAVEQGYNVVVACGGDGTIREVVNGIYGNKAVLGVLPLGTSNDFAKHIGLDNINKAANALINGKEEYIDLGLAELYCNKKKKKILFCSTSGVGFDSKLLKLNEKKFFAKAKNFLGYMAYPLFGLLIMPFYKASEAEVYFKSKNKKIRLKLFMMNANFVKSMSGMKVTPYANTNNKIFDIIMVEDMGIIKKIIGLAWYSLTSKKINFDEVSYISKKGLHNNKFGLSDVASFEVRSDIPADVQLNGDFVGVTPAKFKVIPNALKLLK